jgi:hypothetical protein
MTDKVAILARSTSLLCERPVADSALGCVPVQFDGGKYSMPAKRPPIRGQGRGRAMFERSQGHPAVTRNRQPRAVDIKPQVGERLRWVRELIDENRTRLARSYRVHHTVWEKWERGATYPDPAVMVRFCFDFGITMDWIYRGIPDGIDLKFRRPLLAEHPQIAWAPLPPDPSGPRRPPRGGGDDPEPPAPRLGTASGRRSPATEAPASGGRARSAPHPSLPLPAPSRRQGSDAPAGSDAKDPSPPATAGSRGRPAGTRSKARVRGR